MASSVSVIVNSTPIIALGNIERIELLKDLFGEVVIPEAVQREVTFKDEQAARYLTAYSQTSRLLWHLDSIFRTKQLGPLVRLARPSTGCEQLLSHDQDASCTCGSGPPAAGRVAGP